MQAGKMNRALTPIIALLVGWSAHAIEPEKLQRLKVPSPPWPQGDERGMANQIGPATLQRCAGSPHQSRNRAAVSGKGTMQTSDRPQIR